MQTIDKQTLYHLMGLKFFKSYLTETYKQPIWLHYTNRSLNKERKLIKLN